jgi:alkylation response protein AidB-like acyl-CoA dehydrogenase
VGRKASQRPQVGQGLIGERGEPAGRRIRLNLLVPFLGVKLREPFTQRGQVAGGNLRIASSMSCTALMGLCNNPTSGSRRPVDAKIAELYEGASEIQRLVIAWRVLTGYDEPPVAPGALGEERG